MRAGRWCLAAVAGLALSGCSGSSAPAPAAHGASASSSVTPGALPAGGTLPDPCALVTAAQARSALDGAAGTGKPGSLAAPLAGKSCTWATTSTPVRELVISVRSDSTITAAGESAAGLFAQDISNLSAAQGLAPVAGIGDRAYVGYSNAGSDNAHVLKRDVLMDIVGLSGTDATTPAGEARFLAFVKTAAGKL